MRDVCAKVSVFLDSKHYALNMYIQEIEIKNRNNYNRNKIEYYRDLLMQTLPVVSHELV